MKSKYWISSFALVLIMSLLAACSNSSPNSSSNVITQAEDGPINWDQRIEANKSVGEITYMTGYYYAASPPDIQVVLAEQLGFFDELGLNVNILPGLDADGMKFLATNNAQIASAGSPSIVLQAISNGAPIQGIATFGHVGTSALMVLANSDIEEPADLVGKMIGYHGALPANMLAMLTKNNVDITDVKTVNLGYDLTSFINGDVDALTIYKSNEPYMMKNLGYDVRIIDPGQYGAETSFGVLATNQSFAEKNPGAVSDFLRAVQKAHEYATENPEESIKILAGLSDTVYDEAAELNRWLVERELLQSATITDKLVAYQTEEQWQREIDMLLDAKVISKKLDVHTVMTNRYLDGISNNATYEWPETK